MKLKVAKNGKQYRCDRCQKLLSMDKVFLWRKAEREFFHFCSLRHKEVYIIERYCTPLFPQDSERVTGHVIPVKNGASDQ